MSKTERECRRRACTLEFKLYRSLLKSGLFYGCNWDEARLFFAILSIDQDQGIIKRLCTAMSNMYEA